MLGFSAIIAIMIVSSTYILLQLNTVSNAAKITLTSHVQAVDLAKQLQAILLDENGYAEKYLISRDETYFSLFAETGRRVDRYLNSLRKTQSDEEGRSLVKAMRQAHDSFVSSIKSKRTLQESDNHQLRGDLKSDSIETLQKSLDQLIGLSQASIGSAMTGMEMTTDRSAKVAMLLIAWTLLAAITVAFLITRTITRPIGDLIRGTERIARGKFDRIDVSSHDEIALLANAVNEMGIKIKEINELRTQTMQQISHDVQTPLQAMLSAHDLLKIQCSGPLNAEQIDLLDSIFRGINKVANFSKQYLDLAKIESGTMKYNMAQADLLRIVEPLVDDAKLIADSKNITVELVSLSAPRVIVDKEKIAMVVNNLLSNAIKYTRKDGHIRVKIASCTLGARLEVQDSGVGIVQEDIKKVFERFYQADNVDRVKIKGTGVGLAIVQAFTEGHGGKVYAESTVNHGSTFIVELPGAA